VNSADRLKETAEGFLLHKPGRRGVGELGVRKAEFSSHAGPSSTSSRCQGVAAPSRFANSWLLASSNDAERECPRMLRERTRVT
jgi:hypothetical protein